MLLFTTTNKYMKIIIKTPVVPKQTTTTNKVVIASKPKIEREAKIPVQRFFISHNEKSLMIKFDDMTFGVRMNNNAFEAVMRNTSTKENEVIQKVIKFIKHKKINRLSFAEIAERLQVAIYATSIKSFSNKIEKPIEAVAE